MAEPQGNRLTATRFVVVFAGAATLCVLGLYILLHTQAGLAILADRLGKSLSDETTTVRIVGLKGSVTSSVSSDKITLADSKGVFATASGSRVVWRPLALLQKAIEIEQLSISRLTVARLPATDTPSVPSSTESFASSFDIRAAKIVIDEVFLAQPVLGETQQLSAGAKVSLDGNLSNASVDVTIKRVDGGQDRAELKIDYAARPARFDATVRIEEPAGGVLARLAGLPRGKRLFVDLSGKGPPDAWKGVLKTDLGRDTAINADVSLALRDDSVNVSMAGSARISGLLSPKLAALAAPVVRFRTDAEIVPSQGLTVRQLTAQSDPLTLTGSGSYRFSDANVDVSLDAAVRNHAALAPLLSGVTFDSAKLDAKLVGPILRPRIEVQIQANRTTAGSVRIASTLGSIALVPIAPDSSLIEGTMKLAGLEPGHGVPQGVFEPTLDVAFSGNLGHDEALRNANLSVTSGSSQMNFSGRLNQTGAAEGTYGLSFENIGPLFRQAGFPLDAKLDVDGNFRADMSKGVLRLTTRGAFTRLDNISLQIRKLLGERVAFSGNVDWQSGGLLTVSALRFELAIGRLEADGTFQPHTGALSANLRHAVDDLRKLSGLAGTELKGKAFILASLDGTVEAITAKGRAEIRDLRLDNTAVGTLGVRYDALLKDGGIKTSLHVDGQLMEKKLVGQLNGHFRPQTISLSDIDVAAGENRLTGKLELNGAGDRLTGAVKFKLNDIGDLPGTSELGLSGFGHVDAALGAKNNTDIGLTGTFKNIRMVNRGIRETAIETATLRILLRNPFAKPTATGEVQLDQVRVGGLRRGEAKIGIDGDISKIDWSAHASAKDPFPLTVAGAGTLARSAKGSRLSVTRLNGMFADQLFALHAPFAFTLGAREWRLDPVDFTLAEGRFRLAGSMVDGVLDTEGRFEALPLRLASMIDSQLQIDGRLAGTLRVAGRTDAADIAMTATAREVRSAEMADASFSGFLLKLDVRQSREIARATVELTGEDQVGASLSLRTRPVVGFAPFSITLGSDLPISGEFMANGELALLDKLVGLGDDRVSGQMNAKATIAGTLGNPDIRGDIRLKGGSYEGAATGTVFRNLEAHARLTGSSVRLASLSADDGASGRLTGNGEARFAGRETASDGLSIKLSNFTALRHPLAEAIVSGDVTLAGTFEAARVVGRLQVEKAEISIPEKLPEQIVELEVVEINAQAVNITGRAGAQDPSLAKTFPISLDLTLEFPNRTFVRGRGLDSEWKGNLVVTGMSDAPVMEGKLEAVRGTFAFAGKTFTVKSGSVSFPKSAAEPKIAATAETKLQDLIARVEISGSISKPTISISSEPARPQEDVLAQILFGRTAGQLSAIQAAQLAQTAATLSGKGGVGIVDKIRQTLGVDVLNVDTEKEGGRGASLKAGKYLTDDVFVSVTQGTRTDSQKVGVEVKVLPNVTLESDISGTADSNIGINWKWDY